MAHYSRFWRVFYHNAEEYRDGGMPGAIRLILDTRLGEKGKSTALVLFPPYRSRVSCRESKQFGTIEVSSQVRSATITPIISEGMGLIGYGAFPGSGSGEESETVMLNGKCSPMRGVVSAFEGQELRLDGLQRRIRAAWAQSAAISAYLCTRF